MRLHAKLALLLASHLHQVTEQRPTTNPHGAAHVRGGLVRMEIKNPRLFELVWLRPRPSTRAATGFGRGAASCGPLSFELAFHLGHGAQVAHRPSTGPSPDGRR